MKKSLFWSLFGLPFAAAGLFALAVAGSGAWDAYRMQSWKPVAAKLLSAELETNRGDDSTTHRVRARYRYSDLGRSHESDRVGIYSFADNIGDYHSDLYAQLQSALSNEEAVTAYVNPNDFTASVLSRDPRWGLTGLLVVFGLIFSAVGTALIVGVQLGTRKLIEETERQSLHPDEPWQWRDEWHGGIVRSAGSANVYAGAGFAAVWLLISAPVSFGALEEIRSGNYAALIAFAFPIVGVALAAWAINAWRRQRRFGNSTVAPEQFPIPLGGPAQGEVRVNAAVPVETGFLLRLSCIERRRRTNKRNSQSESILWQDEQTVPRHRCRFSPASAAIPFGFSTPADEPGTRFGGEENEIQWRLDISGECPGTDYAARFSLPIFATGTAAAADALEISSDEPQQRYGRALDPTQLAEFGSRGIQVDRLPDGAEQWVFGRARHKGVAMALSVFTLAWCGFVVMMFTQGAPLWFAGVFAIFALLLFWGASQAWLAEQRVTITHQGIGLRSGIIAAGKPKHFGWTEIADIKPVKGMSSGNKLYYDLKLDTGGQRLHVAARSIDNLKTAELIANSWRRFIP